MTTKRCLIATLATTLAAPAFVYAVAPSTQSKFLNALGASKLQYPDSATDADAAALLAGHDEAYFTLADTDKMEFTQAVDDMRTELRNLNNWNVNTTVQTAHANVSVESQAGEEITIMQIHDDANTGIGTGPNKPLLRIYRSNSDGKAYAIIKSDNGGVNNLPLVDLGTMNTGTYYDIDVTVDNGTLTVNFGGAGTPQVNAIDVSYWNFPSYWKAGLYLQDPGAATVRFNELTWPGAKSVIDDSFADGDKSSTGALDADWFSSSSSGGNSVEIAVNELGLVSGTSGRGMHGTFTPQTLEIGESLVSTLTFTTPATIGSDLSGGLKVALMDFNDAGLAADLTSSSSSVNALYTELPGYYIDFDVNSLAGTDDISIYEHDSNVTGRFLGTSGEWTSLGNSDNVGYDFLASTDYEVILSVTRTGADTMDISGSLSSADGTVIDNFSAEDVSNIANHFGMLGIWANASAFGSTTATDPDNGLSFSNVKVELVNLDANQAPDFTFETIDGANATQDAAYAGSLEASDLEGDALTFSKVSGPAWLTVATDGTLSGTPTAAANDVFVVQVADAGGSNTSTLNITVDAPSGDGSTIVDDNFTDEDRTKTGTLDADWWSSNSSGNNSVEIDANGLGLITGTSGRGLHGTFAPQSLAAGESLTATLTFTTPATVGTAKNDGLKFAIMDLNNAGLAADLTSTSSVGGSNPLYENLPGYLVQFDVNGTSANTNIREHITPNTTGRFLGTNSEWSSLSSSSTAGYAFAANTEYVVIIKLTKTGADAINVFGSLSQGGTLLDSHNHDITSGAADNFGMLGVWVNSNTFGSSNSAGLGADNGITFSNIKIEADGTAANQAPAFVSDPITALNALEGVPYTGNTLASFASDLEGDTMTFTKLTGPAWLVVDSDGTLSGTPPSGTGLDVFTVQVDATGGSDTTTLNITVDEPFTGGILINDSFADDNLASTGALDADWWGTSGTSAREIDPGVLGLRSGTSGRGLHGTFSPQTLGVGDAITATLSFTTPATVGTDRDGAFKFALADLNDPLLAADTTSSSKSVNPLFQNLPAYMINFDVNMTDDSENIGFSEHIAGNPEGRFLGTNNEWEELSAGPAAAYKFLASTDYVVEITLTRTNTGIMDIAASLSLASGGAPLASYSASDSDGTIANNFGMLGAWVNSNTFGSTNGGNVPDNGIDFTNVTIETALDVSGNTAPTAADNSGSIDEDALVGDDVLTVVASDNSGISGFAITGGNTDGAFSITSGGLIEVAAGLDFATTPSYTLTVTVTDDGTPGLQDTATVTITVNEAVSNNQGVVSDTLTGTGGVFEGETDLNIIGVGADPDGDGELNFMEIWRGTDASTSDEATTALILEEHDVSTIVRGSVVIATDAAMDDMLAITVEASHDLDAWRDITANRTVESDTGGVRTLRFHDTIAINDENFFIRFSIDPDGTVAP
ncbi:MAG: polysaccharide lyase family 7 protein [Opitutaceae bacterium]